MRADTSLGRTAYVTKFTLHKDRRKSIMKTEYVCGREVVILRNDWENIGDMIRNTVQDAVDSQDFRRLNETVRNTINNTIYMAGRGMESAEYHTNQMKAAWEEQRRRTSQMKAENEMNQGAQFHAPALYKRTGSIKGFGFLAMITGGMFAAFWAFGSLIIALFGVAEAGASKMPAIIVFLVFAAIAAVIGIVGGNSYGKAKRFEKYVKRLGGRKFCEIEELSKAMGKSKSYIGKDLLKMIRKGWFLQGHIDEQERYFIADHATYGEYQKMRQSEAQRQDQDRQRESTLGKDGMKVIAEGEEYIRKIHASNDAIPGEEISKKISKMENVIQRIFDRVEAHPEQVSDIRKLMEYYLPMTIKLLNAYEELDRQPVQGNNILNSKKEIEDTLDTLNDAFMMLLDDLFEDTAVDVSSDISVLKTMLAQEGLKKKDFN